MRGILTLLTCLAGLLPALAAEPVRAPEAQRILDELRIGLMLHDPLSRERGTGDAMIQAYLVRPDVPSLPRFLVPRVVFGASLNSGGRTSHAHMGLAFTLDVTERVFVEAGIGGAVHDGRFSAAPGEKRNAMGCALHFRESAGIGYRIDAHWQVIGTIEHLSNGGLCDRNRGLTNIGLQLGYRF